MTRILTFDGPHATRRYELVRTALYMGGDAATDRPPTTIRREARLQDAIDALGDLAPTDQDAEARRLKPSNGAGPLRLTLAQEDFDLLQQYSERVRWHPRISRQVVDLWDFLSAAEKQE